MLRKYMFYLIMIYLRIKLKERKISSKILINLNKKRELKYFSKFVH